MDECLALIDPELTQHLRNCGRLDAYIYGFSCSFTFPLLSVCSILCSSLPLFSFICLRASPRSRVLLSPASPPGVSSLSASVRPFEELVQLWDFLLTFGIHLNILAVVAQVILLRDKLLATDRFSSSIYQSIYLSIHT